MASELAHTQDNASKQAGAIIECMIAASSPLLVNLFGDEAPHQDRMLFALALAGACSTLVKESEDNYGLTVEVSPSTLNEAMRVYMLLTGKDIRPYLPVNFLKFADSEQRTLN